MMEMLKQPEPMDFKSVNTADTRKKWDRRFCNYCKAAELKNKDHDVQVAILLELARPDSLVISRTFPYKEATPARAGHPAQVADSTEDYETALAKFAEYCRPRKNTVYERYRFWKKEQVDGESIDRWGLIDLRSQVAICEFGAQDNLMIRDKIAIAHSERSSC